MWMVDLNVNFIYGVNHGCQILVLLIDILVTGRENTVRNSQQSVPCTWQVAWVLGSQLS